MKPFLLSVLVLGSAFGTLGQGQVYIANYSNTSPSITATANGLFFLNIGGACHLINQDFNLNFYGGTDSANLQLLKTFTAGTATGGNAGPGFFSDPSGLAVTLPGATTTGFFRIEAWLNSSGATWATASARNSPSSANTIFSNPVTTPPNLPPTLTGMPAVEISDLLAACPEPSTLALAALGAAFLFFRWRKQFLR